VRDLKAGLVLPDRARNVAPCLIMANHLMGWPSPDLITIAFHL
jgi:hypothetical protein